MPHTSRMRFWLKVWTLPLGLWLTVGLTYIGHDNPETLAILRSFFWPYAILATVFAGLVFLVRRLRHAE